MPRADGYKIPGYVVCHSTLHIGDHRHAAAKITYQPAVKTAVQAVMPKLHRCHRLPSGICSFTIIYGSRRCAKYAAEVYTRHTAGHRFQHLALILNAPRQRRQSPVADDIIAHRMLAAYKCKLYYFIKNENRAASIPRLLLVLCFYAADDVST